MVEKTSDKSAKPCCEGSQEKKLVKATDLPIHGNPFPPKDIIQDEKPGLIESQVASIRTTLQPYVSPLASVYEKTNDVVSIGWAHSQSAIQRLAENQNSILNALMMSAAGLIGVGLARRGGVLRKLLFGSVFFGGAVLAIHPTEVEERAQLLWYIAKNKLPDAAKQHYEKFTKGNNSNDPDGSKNK